MIKRIYVTLVATCIHFYYICTHSCSRKSIIVENNRFLKLSNLTIFLKLFEMRFDINKKYLCESYDKY